jgi:hypothetical protein
MDNIGAACDIAMRYGRKVMIEPLNAIDRPTYLLTRQAQAVEVIKTLDRDNLGIMVDLFHLQRGEGNLIERMRMSLPYAIHVQIADVPGRHEPGTGEINFAAVFGDLDRAGYAGWGDRYLWTERSLLVKDDQPADEPVEHRAQGFAIELHRHRQEQGVCPCRSFPQVLGALQAGTELVDVLACIRVEVALEPALRLERLVDQQVLAHDTLACHREAVLVTHPVEQEADLELGGLASGFPHRFSIFSRNATK